MRNLRFEITADAQRARVWGYDAIRFVAMLCVALIHLLSLYDLDPSIIPVYIGLPMFAGLSGYLALRERGNARAWLAKRLARIYSSYLPFILILLFADYIIGYKQLTAPLAISQILGIATLTHPEQMIGVHTWFITFIVACYLAAALIRWQGWLLWLFLAVAIIGCYFRIGQCWLFLAFVSGGLVSCFRGAKAGSAALSLIYFGIYWITNDRSFMYPLAGVLSLLIGSFFVGTPPRIATLASHITYEFYLCHGPVYFGLARLVHAPIAVTLVGGTVLAVLCAIVLNFTATQIRRAIRDFGTKDQSLGPVEQGTDYERSHVDRRPADASTST